ncbi:flagellar export chaperone FliS [Hydrocarboniclastica marina]|uniref:Flagellar secretion chaperone FliS n=1 Tax=Hydrocarboniclastica marina TaxID=2259620 RepID=A0A4P7XFR4_9ALTE|nr:flagellar export chaperone FliS [Hydrocarboniclastica marina]MAL97127.1 flagellar protein FliS [Alteromonadaceae bacterium]QCF25535.1 flagella export chaperone FliS [Hydrocarboniclastica marina]|tara:strand:+ start:2634 stop:3047 length:414 start_codon:yes stop_codon:yes gene_type:complete
MNALQQYQRINTHTSMTDADPHRLIQLLLNGALERLNMAKAQMLAKNFEGKGRLINKTIDIISSLREFLDFEKGQDLAERLDSLYDYMARTLLQANLKNDTAKLDEVAHLLRQIKEAWDGIREEAVEFLGQQQAANG